MRDLVLLDPVTFKPLSADVMAEIIEALKDDLPPEPEPDTPPEPEPES